MDLDKPRYTYAPLADTNSIRVLELLPHSVQSAPLQARLVHTQLIPSPGTYSDSTIVLYEAVSYCWGDPVFTHSLECDEGHLLYITPNVNALLRRLRKSTHPRYIWIDSICIDQANEEEKHVQIGLMGDIYRRAVKVHVWLGEEEDGDQIGDVFGFFREMGIECARKHNLIRKEEIQRRMTYLMRNNVAVASVDRFLQRAWYRRRWILQEVALGSDITVRCGRFKLPWNYLFQSMIAMRGYVSKSSETTLSTDSALSLESIAALRSDSNHILDLLFRFHASECMDPKDRIFALYGFADDIPRFPIHPKSTWEDVYLDLAVACVREGRLISLLQHLIAFGPLDEEGRRMPSWVPRWNGRRVSEHRFTLGPAYEIPYKCFIEEDMPRSIWVEDDCGLVGPVRLIHGRSRSSLREYPDELVWRRPDRSLSPPRYLDVRAKVVAFDDESECHETTMAMMDAYMHCVDKTDMGLNDQHRTYFLQGLSAALLDTILHFDAEGHVAHWAKNYPTPGRIQIPEFKEISDGENKVKKEYIECFKRFTYLFQLEFPILINSNETIFQKVIQKEQIKGLARALKGHNFFYVGGYAGLTRCAVRDRDFVFRPMESLDHLDTNATAFILRPVRNEPQDVEQKPEQFRIIGLCFMGRSYDHRGGSLALV